MHTRKARWTVLLAAALLATACTPASRAPVAALPTPCELSSPQPYVGPEHDPAIDYLMQTYHVDRATAAFYLTIEGAGPPLAVCVQDVLGDRFAGIWIDHTDGCHIVIMSTDPDPKPVRAATAWFFAPDHLRIRYVIWSKSFLDGFRDSLHHQLGSRRGFRRTAVDVAANQVEVIFDDTPEGHRTAADSYVKDVLADTPPGMIRVEFQPLPQLK